MSLSSIASESLLSALSSRRMSFKSRSAECVKLFETTVSSKCYAAIVSGWLMKTVGSSAGGSGVPFTKRFGLRAYAA